MRGNAAIHSANLPCLSIRGCARILLSSLLLAVGCAHRRPAATVTTSPAHDRQRADTRAWTAQSTVVPTCDGQETSPSFRGSKPCGLVAAEVFETDFVQVFIAQVCGGALDDVCESKHRSMFLARIEERYPYADYGAVDRHCEAWPLKCQNDRDLELIVLVSHNDGVRAEADRRLAQIDADEARAIDRAERRERERLEQERIAEEDERRRMAAFADGMNRLANVLKDAQPPPPPPTQQTRCSSETRFGRTETNCTTIQQ